MDKAPSPTRKSITLPETMWEAITAFRFDRRIATEAEAVRQLIQAGLDAKDAE